MKCHFWGRLFHSHNAAAENEWLQKINIAGKNGNSSVPLFEADKIIFLSNWTLCVAIHATVIWSTSYTGDNCKTSQGNIKHFHFVEIPSPQHTNIYFVILQGVPIKTNLLEKML